MGLIELKYACRFFTTMDLNTNFCKCNLLHFGWDCSFPLLLEKKNKISTYKETEIMYIKYYIYASIFTQKIKEF
jgi:hypothetical protein